MHKPDPIETVLARLMPPALSETGQHKIESMLDALAGNPAQAVPAKPSRLAWNRRILAGGIAAAGAAAALIFPLATPPSPTSWAVIAPASTTPAGMILMGESDRIESMTDEGWQEDSDGSTMRAMRLNVVGENSLLDEETGIVMQVSEPREELLLMPVSTF
jgi:hypothetical protein